MDALERFNRHERLLASGVVAPLAACLILLPFRNNLPNTSSALLLVLVVVAVASAGDRLAGLLAALSAGLWFDFFLTRPYGTFAIISSVDLQTALLLLGVGVAITEIAHRGRKQQAMASAHLGYLEGVGAAAKVAGDGSSSTSALIEAVTDQIMKVMGLAKCRFDYGPGFDYPRLEPDGTLRWHNQSWAVDSLGLPTEKETELIARSGGKFMGRFLLTPNPRTRSSKGQRQVAVALATQVGAALGARRDPHSYE
ncbi:MAG TPA: DUF4118 domain-containing protein [Dermatophilaceae bacterium]